MCRWPPHPSQPYFGWHHVEQFQVMLSGETTSETTENQPGHPPGAYWPMALNQSVTLGTCQRYQPPPVPRCYCFPTHNNISGPIFRVIQKNTLKIISSEKALISSESPKDSKNKLYEKAQGQQNPLYITWLYCLVSPDGNLSRYLWLLELWASSPCPHTSFFIFHPTSLSLLEAFF